MEESSRVKKKSALHLQSLDVVKIRGKGKFYVFPELPFKKCKGYTGQKKKKRQQLALGKHISLAEKPR